MKKLLLILALAGPLWGQAGNMVMTQAAGAPAGGCAFVRFYINTTNGDVYYCYLGSWTILGPGAAVGSKWNAITNPDGNLALTMAARTSTFTYGNATSTSNLFRLTDTASNTGTGYIFQIDTASGSAAKPLRVCATGTTNCFTYDASANLLHTVTSSGATAYHGRIILNWTNPGGGDADGLWVTAYTLGANNTGGAAGAYIDNLIDGSGATDYGIGVYGVSGCRGSGTNACNLMIGTRGESYTGAARVSDTVTGLFGWAGLGSTATTAAITTARPLYGQLFAYGTGTITSGIGVHIDTPDNTGGGTFTTVYGMKIEDQSVGTNKFGIYTGSGKNSFGDAIVARVAAKSLGSATEPFQHVYLYGGGTFGSHSFQLTGTPTAHRAITIQDADQTLVGRDTTDTLTNKTLTTPTISATGFANAQHAHAAANSGGTLNASAIAAGQLAAARGGTGIDSSASTGYPQVAAGTWSVGTLTKTFQVTVDGGGSAITTGVAGDIWFPQACTITEWEIMADQSGSITFDLWKDTRANYPPTVADTITASAKPAISGATNGNSTTLTGWTTAISANDTIRFNIDSAATVTRVTLQVKVTVP